MLPGGDGRLGIQGDGTMTSQVAHCNPVARNRQAFADNGIALVDAASDGTTYVLANVAAVIQYMRTQNPLPTWLTGASSSTSATVSIAVASPAASPLGLLMFSPDFPDRLVSQITGPTFVLYHASDRAQFGREFYASLTAARVREVLALTGGSNVSCGVHLFQGLDAPFVAAMTSFITRYNALLAPAAPAVASAQGQLAFLRPWRRRMRRDRRGQPDLRQ